MGFAREYALIVDRVKLMIHDKDMAKGTIICVEDHHWYGCTHFAREVMARLKKQIYIIGAAAIKYEELLPFDDGNVEAADGDDGNVEGQLRDSVSRARGGCVCVCSWRTKLKAKRKQTGCVSGTTGWAQRSRICAVVLFM